MPSTRPRDPGGGRRAAEPGRPGRRADADPWERVALARHPTGPWPDYLAGLFDDFVELRGDRASGDDAGRGRRAGRLGGAPVVVVGHQKGRDTRELGRPATSACRTRRATARPAG